jgi:L-iditol 2-dehydrogenase
MKALVLTAYKQFEIQDVPDPRPAAGEVLVVVKTCGICGSDIHGMDGSSGRRIPPVIMGHEAAGVIAEVGPGVEGWSAGDRVTFDSTVYCGRCWFCRQGHINLCDNRRVLGVSCGEYRRDGAFAEYVVVPQHILYRLPEGLTFERAALVEGLSIAVHGVNQTALRLNDTAVVVGSGLIGLLVIQALRAAGAGRILAVDIEEGRLEMALKLGADEALHAGQVDVAIEVAKRTEGRGADVAIEVAGFSSTVQTAVASVRKGGQVTLVGNLAPKIEFPLQAVVTREITINSSCASTGEYPACLDLLTRGTVRVDPLISAVAPLAEGAKWFGSLYRREGNLFKVILQP